MSTADSRGSGWTAAPAVALVATACCVCGRPLLDAESLASGIGPVCADKTEFGRPGLDPEVRAEVNRLVYQLAALQKQPGAVTHLRRLVELGFAVLADRVAARLEELVEVRVELVNGVGVVLSEMPRLDDERFEMWRQAKRQIPGWTFRHVEKMGGRRDVVPNRVESIQALYRALTLVVPGKVGKSPKGLFVVPSPEQYDAMIGRRAA